jgi:hypothetical protein
VSATYMQVKNSEERVSAVEQYKASRQDQGPQVSALACLGAYLGCVVRVGQLGRNVQLRLLAMEG